MPVNSERQKMHWSDLCRICGNLEKASQQVRSLLQDKCLDSDLMTSECREDVDLSEEGNRLLFDQTSSRQEVFEIILLLRNLSLSPLPQVFVAWLSPCPTTALLIHLKSAPLIISRTRLR